MSTVLEAPSYTMPKVNVGQMVQYFTDGERERPLAGVVRRVSQRSIDIVTIDTNVVDHNSVRHATDTDLPNNPNLRKFGTWDFVPGENAAAREVTELKMTIERLTKRLERLEQRK